MGKAQRIGGRVYTHTPTGKDSLVGEDDYRHQKKSQKLAEQRESQKVFRIASSDRSGFPLMSDDCQLPQGIIPLLADQLRHLHRGHGAHVLVIHRH